MFDKPHPKEEGSGSHIADIIYAIYFFKNWEKIQRLSQVIGDLESMEQANNELDDSCDIQHVGRETVVKASDDNENESLSLGEDYLPLTFDADHEIIPNNAKRIDT